MSLLGFQLNTTIHAAFWAYSPNPTIDPTGREVMVNVNNLQYIEATQPTYYAQNASNISVTGGVLTVTVNNNLNPTKPAPVLVLLAGFTNAFFLNNQLFTTTSVTPTQFTAAYSSVANISATAIANNVLTVYCYNSFVVGSTVTLNGTNEAFLNGQTVTVTSATDEQFTANFTHANYSYVPDTGTATLSTYSGVEPAGAMVVDPNTRKAWLYYDETNVSTSQAPRHLVGVVASKFVYDMESLFLING
jgi:hypothetical protein